MFGFYERTYFMHANTREWKSEEQNGWEKNVLFVNENLLLTHGMRSQRIYLLCVVEQSTYTIGRTPHTHMSTNVRWVFII